MSNVVRLGEAAGWSATELLAALARLALASLIAVCCSLAGPLRARVFALAERLYLATGLAFYATTCLALLLP